MNEKEAQDFLAQNVCVAGVRANIPKRKAYRFLVLWQEVGMEIFRKTGNLSKDHTPEVLMRLNEESIN